MNLLFLAEDGPGNAWLIREVEQAVPIREIIRPDWSSAPPAKPAPTSRKPKLFKSPYTRVARKLRKRHYERLDRGNGFLLEKSLFSSTPMPAPACPVVTIPWWLLNAPETCDRLRALAPDLMVVSGAPMLQPALYSIPRLGTVNLHMGISPDYRGQHTMLWPLLHRDYTHIGATLHYINEGVDSGPVLFRVYPALEPADDLVSIEAKIVRLAARTLRDFLKTMAARADKPAPGRQFSEKGLLVRGGDRTIRHDLRLRFQRLVGIRPPNLPERVELFYLDEPA